MWELMEETTASEIFSHLILLILTLTCLFSGVLAYVVNRLAGTKGLWWLSAISICVGAAVFVVFEYLTQFEGFPVSPAIAFLIPALVIGISLVISTNKRWFGVRRY